MRPSPDESTRHQRAAAAAPTARKPRLRTYRVRSGALDMVHQCPYRAAPKTVALLCLERHSVNDAGSLGVLLEVSGRSMDDTLYFDTVALLAELGRIDCRITESAAA